MNTVRLSLVLSLGLVATQYSAAENSYIEFNLGRSGYSDLQIETANVEETSREDSDTSLNFTYGYQMYDGLALQASYYDLGQYSTSMRLNFPPYDQGPDSRISADVSGWAIAIVPQLPLSEQFRLFGELGLHSYTADIRVESPNFVNGEFSSMDVQTDESSSKELFYAIGITWDITEQIYFNLKHGQYELEEDELTNTALGVGYKF